MIIKETAIYLGKPYDLIYEDAEDFATLPYEKCQQAYGICFYKGMVILGFSRRMRKWSLIGGTIEPNENFEDALSREIKEETNMKLLKCWPIGYQKVVDTDIYQLRYACLVEPYGPFIADPDATEDNGVDRIIAINPRDFSKYVSWGKIGNRLIKRAIAIINQK